MGGDPGNAKLVLSCSTLEFGKYQGQTFRWHMENDVGYAMHLVPVEAYGIALTCAVPFHFRGSCQRNALSGVPAGRTGEVEREPRRSCSGGTSAASALLQCPMP